MGLADGWWMLYETFWALILGFFLSGAVQVFISRKQMRNALGDHKPKSIVKASLFGIVSSSCSYAASALAKSLVSKGSDFTAAMVFMFASTNLVIELGLVLWILMGWQFALAEFVGGTVMIILLALLIPRLVPITIIRKTQNLLVEESADRFPEVDNQTFAQKIRSPKAWSGAAGYTIGDFIMLRRELVIGFIVAGLAMSLVPLSFWNILFISGNGFWSALENAIIGPIIAFISFVCSVGNIPLAAALWNSGITFGGVIAFIFADLLALPLVVIYVKYYGRELGIRISLVFWLVISISGLITEGIFLLFKGIPTEHKVLMGASHIGVNATTILNVIALLLLANIYRMYKKREVNAEFAQDPICGMQVRIADAPADAQWGGKMYYFCRDGCRDEFLKDPTNHIKV